MERERETGGGWAKFWYLCSKVTAVRGSETDALQKVLEGNKVMGVWVVCQSIGAWILSEK